jgi:diguanylate cyclase (GGDEF)-like protein
VSSEDVQRLPQQRPVVGDSLLDAGDAASQEPFRTGAQGRRRRRVSRLHHRVQVAEAVAELSHQALTAQEPDELLRQSLQVAVDVVGVEYGTAVRRLSNGQLRVAKELGPQPLLPGTILPLAVERSYVLTVVDTERPFISADLRNDPRVTPPGPLLNRGVVSGLAVPVRGSEAVLGVLAVHSQDHRRFDRHDVAVVKALAAVVATAWEQATHREQLGHQALHDPLTGLANRTLFLDRLEHVLAHRPESGHADPNQAAVMLVDLDDFKGINDGFGHVAGDELLKVAAHRLRSAVRPQDTIARLGGDEFGVLCEGVPDASDAVDVATRMGSFCAEPVELCGSMQSVTASFGITLTRPSTDRSRDVATLLGEADAALYRAKDLGRGRVQVFDATLRRATSRRRAFEAELKAGLERGEFRLHYQPVRRTGDLHPIGVEALLRWEHPSRGLLMPGDFIPAAEQSGLLVPLGKWVVRTACRQVAGWQRQLPGEDPLWVAVNVSPRQLGDADLPAVVAAAQQEAGLARGSLVLELTESALMPGDETHREALTQLRETGVRLFLDDFGTGYSSLTHLTELPVQAVKIDRSFVAGIPTNRRHTAVVSALIALSAELDLRVIAEGLETREQLEALRAMRCQAVQGFLLDLPTADPDVG